MIPVDMRWSKEEGWHYITKWPMTDKALTNATEKARVFYLGLWNDLPDGPAREEIQQALRDLDALKIRNVVNTSETPPVRILTSEET